MNRKKLLIPHDFNFYKYHPTDVELPYEATGQKLKDEISKRCRELQVVCAESQKETYEEIKDADYLVVYHVKKDLLDRASRLKWIQCGGSGIDHFFKMSDITAQDLKDRGIILSNAAGVTRIDIGEHVLSMMLVFSRRMHRAMRQQLRREWDIFCADELFGKTVGIIGLGEIGSRVAELCKCFGMVVIGTKKTPSVHSGVADEIYPAQDFPNVLKKSDYVVLSCPITEGTRGMISAEMLSIMKPTTYLINIARGELVDEKALVHALKTGIIAGAGLDTFGPMTPQRTMKDQEALSLDSELWDLDNVIISPNNASGTPRIYEYLADITVKNYELIKSGMDPKGRKA